MEEFQIDQDSALPRAEHDLAHDRLAAELGRVLERLPRVIEVPADDAASRRAAEPVVQPEPEPEPEPGGKQEDKS